MSLVPLGIPLLQQSGWNRKWLASAVSTTSNQSSACLGDTPSRCSMMTSSNGNIFRVTGHLCGEFTRDRWIPRTKASDSEFSLICAWINGWVNNREAGELRCHRAHYDVIMILISTYQYIVYIIYINNPHTHPTHPHTPPHPHTHTHTHTHTPQKSTQSMLHINQRFSWIWYIWFIENDIT